MTPVGRRSFVVIRTSRPLPFSPLSPISVGRRSFASLLTDCTPVRRRFFVVAGTQLQIYARLA